MHVLVCLGQFPYVCYLAIISNNVLVLGVNYMLTIIIVPIYHRVVERIEFVMMHSVLEWCRQSGSYPSILLVYLSACCGPGTFLDARLWCRCHTQGLGPGVGIKCTDCDARLPDYESLLYSLLAAWLWASNFSVCLSWVVTVWNGLIFAKHVDQYLVHSKYHINICWIELTFQMLGRLNALVYVMFICIYTGYLPFITQVVHSGVFLQTKGISSKGELTALLLLDSRLPGTFRRHFFSSLKKYSRVVFSQ